MTATPLKIDFVSDIVCPWCAVGLASLEKALAQLAGEVQVELHFQPFQLNPDMSAAGQDITEHLTQKYGSTPAQQAANWQAICERGAELGFIFRKEGRERTWNTLDAHRLLHWAGTRSTQVQYALKKALLVAYMTEGRSPADHEVLVAAAVQVGLDADDARAVLTSNAFAAEVLARVQFYAQHGIRAVPSVIVNDRHLIQGGQPPEVFVQALREAAAESVAAR
jgi:predicted DsbA family dithiol-disulfide isomerase